MKSIFYSVLFLAFLAIQGCHCNCTELACNGDNRPFSIVFDTSAYTQAELDTVWMVRTDVNYNTIDSNRITTFLGDKGYTFDFQSTYSFYFDAYEIKDYNYILINSSLNQVDTLHNINYTIILTSERCNSCDGVNCVDEYYDIKNYEDPTFYVNQTAGSGYVFDIDKH